MRNHIKLQTFKLIKYQITKNLLNNIFVKLTAWPIHFFFFYYFCLYIL